MNTLTYLRTKVRTTAEQFGTSEEGATATEYVFLLVFIALLVVVGAQILGGNLDAALTEAGNTVGSEVGN